MDCSSLSCHSGGGFSRRTQPTTQPSSLRSRMLIGSSTVSSLHSRLPQCLLPTPPSHLHPLQRDLPPRPHSRLVHRRNAQGSEWITISISSLRELACFVSLLPTSVTISPFWPCFWPSSFFFSHQVHASLKSLCKKTTKTSHNKIVLQIQQ
jgi:hypothetical protein